MNEYEKQKLLKEAELNAKKNMSVPLKNKKELGCLIIIIIIFVLTIIFYLLAIYYRHHLFIKLGL